MADYGTPAYQQVAEDLRAQIRRGELAVGDPIPSTSRLCEQYKVSATVARAAVAILRQEGIVRGQPGKAVFVVATPDEAEQRSVRVEDLAEQIEQLRAGLDELSSIVKDEQGGATVAELRAEVAELRRMLAVLQTQLMDLYGRTGEQFPHDAKPTPSAASGTERRRR